MTSQILSRQAGMFRRLTVAVAAMVICAFYLQAEIPSGYYRSLNGKKEADLKTAICSLVSNFVAPTDASGFAARYNALPTYFRQTDVYPQSTRWWDMYSNIPFYSPSFKGLNREHAFPKSWWGGSTTINAYIDLNHLYPSEMDANQAKSNYPLGTVDMRQTVKFNNGCCKVGYPVSGQGGGANFVFEPADEYKGDFARTYFYMVTCYQNLKWKTTYMVAQNTYPTLNQWSVNLLLKWHRQDPVSEKETLRNDAVYKIQNNRNPFIDYPQLVEYIWGNRVGEAFTESSSGQPVGDPELITPVQGMTLEFGEVALGQTVQSKLWFNGRNITTPLSLRLYRDDFAQFDIPTKSIAASLVNSDEGYWLTVSYKPTELGDHTARLLISDYAPTGSRAIEVRGSCLPVPELSACTATAATDITDEGYTANWTVPAADVVDYWIVTRTRYEGGVATTEEVLAEGTSQYMDDFEGADYETYSVQSVRLGYRSPMSNVITVNHAGVTDVTVDEQPLAVSVFEGAMRFDVASEHTNGRIFDTQGRQVMHIDVVTPGLMINLPAGIYLIVTDQQKRPVKAIVR